jgi:hypothetical protein
MAAWQSRRWWCQDAELVSLRILYHCDLTARQLLAATGISATQAHDPCHSCLQVIDENVEVDTHLADLPLRDRLEVDEWPVGAAGLQATPPGTIGARVDYVGVKKGSPEVGDPTRVVAVHGDGPPNGSVGHPAILARTQLRSVPPMAGRWSDQRSSKERTTCRRRYVRRWIATEHMKGDCSRVVAE